jgi:hypothetical protein
LDKPIQAQFSHGGVGKYNSGAVHGFPVFGFPAVSDLVEAQCQAVSGEQVGGFIDVEAIVSIVGMKPVGDVVLPKVVKEFGRSGECFPLIVEADGPVSACNINTLAISRIQCVWSRV